MNVRKLKKTFKYGYPHITHWPADACWSEVSSPRSCSNGKAGNRQHLEEKPPTQQHSGSLVDINNWMFLQCCCSRHSCDTDGTLWGSLALPNMQRELFKDTGCDATRNRCLFRQTWMGQSFLRLRMENEERGGDAHLAEEAQLKLEESKLDNLQKHRHAAFV